MTATLPLPLLPLDLESPADLHLDQLSQGQKLRLLWQLWGDLSNDREQTSKLPQWQTELLHERKKAVEEGREKFINFEVGLVALRNRIQLGTATN